jgi:hypothetical protein
MANMRTAVKNILPTAALLAAVRVNRYLRRNPTEREVAALYRQIGRPSTINGGPFRGMRYITESTCGAILPKILGIYELEIQPLVESVVALGPDLVVDVGSAEGYYAVGLARRLPDARVVCFDIDRFARHLLKDLAARNGMEARIEIREACSPEVLGPLVASASRPLVICDCEGYEDLLLDPSQCPALIGAWIFVELHDFMRPGVSGRLMERFQGTHEITTFDARPRTPSDCADHLGIPDNQLALALSELRPEGMQWYSMWPKAWPRSGSGGPP